jgi:hypothetical protein
MAPFYEFERLSWWKIFSNKEKRLQHGDVVEITRKAMGKEDEGRKKVASVLVKNDNEIELTVIDSRGLLVKQKKEPFEPPDDPANDPEMTTIYDPIGTRFKDSKISLKREGIAMDEKYDPNVVRIRWSDSGKE